MDNMTQEIDVTEAEAAEMNDIRIEEELEQSYIDYAMSVIAGRALPDIRDGLKPVQRRILYKMDEQGATKGSSHRKSSSIVGETMGDYHPHGDSSIYQSLVRMAQDFTMRHPLVDGQGNFGSIDDDPAAAMRYTEARLQPIASELLSDIGKETINYQSNYDDRLQEPDVLPAKYPNLLVNGSSGIAVGMSTKIPPHNLSEVIDATTHLLENPGATIEDLLEYIEGPDFPTGATIVNEGEMEDIYQTGRGKFTIRAEYHVEEGQSDSIVITEIPYQKSKAKLIEELANFGNSESVTGIRSIRDESNKDNIRIVVELKQNSNTDLIENKLLNSVLETSYNPIMLALVDGQPQVLNLKEILQEFISFRKTIVTKRTEYELTQLNEQEHRLAGRLIALNNIDEVVERIKSSEQRDEAVESLTSEFDLTEEQALHITRMQLQSLTALKKQEIQNEYEEVLEKIEKKERILDSEKAIRNVIAEELQTIKNKYGDERKTKITVGDVSLDETDLIPNEEFYLVATDDGYIKRTPSDVITSTSRNVKGLAGIDIEDGVGIDIFETATTHDTLIFVTNKGTVYQSTGYNLPEYSRIAKGEVQQKSLNLDSDERVTAVEVISDEVRDDISLTFVTENGYVKRTDIEEYLDIRPSGITGIQLDDEDTVISLFKTADDDEIILGNQDGRVIRFTADDVNRTGRRTKGVRGMRTTSQVVAGGRLQDESANILTITENGYGKQTEVTEFRNQSRDGKGVSNIDVGERNGPVISFEIGLAVTDVGFITSNGNIARMPIDEISTYSRQAKGLSIIKVEENIVEEMTFFH